MDHHTIVGQLGHQPYGTPLTATHCIAVPGPATHTAGQVRVTIRLVDAENERHVWGDSFDGFIQDARALHDQVVAGVLCEVQPRILGELIGCAQRADLSVLGGSEMTLRALPLALLPNHTEQALVVLGRAMTLTPDCALALGLAGWCHAKRATPWNAQAAEEKAKASRLADRAGILAPADPLVLALRASIAHLEREYEIAVIGGARRRNRSDMRVGVGSAWLGS